MRLPNNKTDMLSMIAKESGRSRQLVKFVIDNFERSLRYYLSNPMNAGTAILLKGLGKFEFDVEKAKKRLKSLTARRKEQFYKEFLNKFDDNEQEEE